MADQDYIPALDFSILSDDHLIDLIRAACQEAARRNIASIAQNVMIDEAEKARIAREAIERERSRSIREDAERIAREALSKERDAREAEARKAQEKKLADTWAWKEEMGRKVSEVLRPKKAQTLTVWNKTDKRIYLGHGYGDNMVEYHHTGNSYKKPGHLVIHKRPGSFTSEEWHGGKEQEVESQLLPLFQEICQKWNSIEFEVPAYIETQTNNQEAA